MGGPNKLHAALGNRAGGLGFQRPPDLSATEDELLLGLFTIPIVLAAWGLRVGVRAVRRR